MALSRSIRTGRWRLPRLNVCMRHRPAPRSAVFARDFGLSAMAGCVGTVARPSEEWVMHALRVTVPQPRLPVGTVFHCAMRAGKPPDAAWCSRHVVCHTGTPGDVIGAKRRSGPTPRHFPRFAGGRPFSARPVRQGVRRPLTPRADPASPQRLAVYPRRDGRL
nr:hypothetical protein SHINE37_10650 [Rhizobiaceae bacterium]